MQCTARVLAAAAPRLLAAALPVRTLVSNAHACLQPQRRAAATARALKAQSVAFIAPTPAHLAVLAAVLAKDRRPGDAYLLFGAVGAGKSSFWCVVALHVANSDCITCLQVHTSCCTARAVL
jgi:hypothetical protein